MADNSLSVLNSIFLEDPLIDEFGLLIEIPKSELKNMKTTNVPESSTEYIVKEHKLGVSFAFVVKVFKSARKEFEKVKSKNMEFFKKDDCEMMMQCTRAMLMLNADYVTAWNARKKVLLHELYGLDDAILEELKFCNFILLKHPKSGETWSHRKFVFTIAWKRKLVLEDVLQREFDICERVAKLYPKNYFAWTYRHGLISMIAAMKDSWDILQRELRTMEKWTNCNVSDHSGLQHREVVILEMIRNSFHADLLRFLQGAKFFHLVEKKKIPIAFSDCRVCDIVSSELYYITHLQSNFPGRESLWYHRRFLFGCVLLQLQHEMFSSIAPLNYFLKSEIAYCDDQIQDLLLDRFELNKKFAISYKIFILQKVCL